MEASLTCAVCLGVFRDPVTLPLCSHNFCKSCVLECGGETHTRGLHFTLPGPAQVTCPLCRKVSSIPGGLAVLPINTTLAELVRFLSLGSREQGAGAQEAEYSEKGAAGRCPEHPEHKLELFCKNCAVLCCGKCVSCHHQGIFHNVNLLDMVYQEEKLIFFNSLKKLREMHERFTKNTSDDNKDVKETLKKNIDVVSLAFDEAYKALDLKKKQCLEFIKQQQNAAIKRREVRETAVAHQKVTVESLLKDCETLVDESEPKCFLQMACSLNKRMTSNLDLMELTASHDQDIVNPKPIIVDLKAVLDAISAVNITANVSQPKFNGISFKTITKIWNPEQTPAEKYSELRMKYYEDSVVQENTGDSLPEGKVQTLSNAEDSPNLRTGEATRLNAKIRRSDFSGACSTSKNIQESIDKAESKMEIAQEPQKDGLNKAVFKFPTYAAVRAKDPVSCSLKGAASDLSLDNKVQKETEVLKVVPSFCLGKSNTTDLTKPSKSGKSWKKPKTASLLQTTANAEPFESKPFFIFSSKMDPFETKVADPFYNPFSQQECNAQGKKDKSFSEDHATQSSSCEEFYDANSDAEETEQARPSNSKG
ncbi:E3 ubiquitin-protein ligase TRIM63-like isoform X2 [Lithobates pipiens]